MFAKIKEYIQKVFKSKYSTMIALALAAHLGVMVIITNVFNLSYGIGLLLFWTYIWMVECYKNQETSGFAQALVCGPVGWVLLPDCLNPISLRKSLEGEGRKTRLLWSKGCLLASKISESFRTIRSFLMQLGTITENKMTPSEETQSSSETDA